MWLSALATSQRRGRPLDPGRNPSYFFHDMSDHPIIPADRSCPAPLRRPLNGKPIFPGILTPLALPSQADAETVEKAVAGDSLIGLILTRTEGAENPSAEDLFTVGTAAKIVRKINLPDGGVNVFITTLKRFKVKRVLSPSNPITVAVEYVEDEIVDTPELKALMRALISEMKQISEATPCSRRRCACRW